MAPTIEYGVNVVTERGFAGNASMRKKTLHRMLNDLIDTWESASLREFILLTAHEHDPHLEALSTVITSGARVRVVDIFEVDFVDCSRVNPSRCTATKWTRPSCCTSRRISWICNSRKII